MTSVLGQPILAKKAGAMERPAEDNAASHEWVMAVVSAEGPAILRMLWRILREEADVLDAYQDCFCHLARQRPAPGPRTAKAYVYRTASNIAIDMVRARRRREVHQPAVVQHQQALKHAASRDGAGDIVESPRLGDAIARLPDHLRNVITLRDLGRLPYEKVAEILNIEPATARVYRRHAVVRMSEMLAKEESL